MTDTLYLLLRREVFSERSTIGTLSGGGFVCDTLEDKDRKLEEFPNNKQFGKTAIPRGRYKVVLDWSPRFQIMLPHVLDVPGFEGVRIHPGNSAEDTDGCILVGSGRGEDFIRNSRATFEKFMTLLAVHAGPVQLEIV